MCIIIDGMDQMKLMIPQLLHQMKAYSSAWRLKTHLTGVLNHGREAIGYFDQMQWPHDSNLTINVILHVILRMESIPDKLYLQMDNCWRENKNQYVITFLAMLVKIDIFKKVKKSISKQLKIYAYSQDLELNPSGQYGPTLTSRIVWC